MPEYTLKLSACICAGSYTTTSFSNVLACITMYFSTARSMRPWLQYASEAVAGHFYNPSLSSSKSSWQTCTLQSRHGTAAHTCRWRLEEPQVLPSQSPQDHGTIQGGDTRSLAASPVPWTTSNPDEEERVFEIRDVPAGAPGLGRTDSGQPGKRKAARASSDCTSSGNTCSGAGRRRSVARRPCRPFVETIASDMTGPRKKLVKLAL